MSTHRILPFKYISCIYLVNIGCEYMNNSNSINETETKDYSVKEFPIINDIITAEITSESMFRLDLFI